MTLTPIDARAAIRPGAPPWIVGPRFDMALFIAPALLSLIPFVTSVALRWSPIVFLWIWLLGFDGPHMAAGYARTYADPGMRTHRKELLWGSLLAFAVGPVFLLVSVAVGTRGPFILFLAGMSVYAVHHVVRQHWGFVAISARARVGCIRSDRWLFYAGCWAPYVYFLASHPTIRSLVGLPAGGDAGIDVVARVITAGAATCWLSALSVSIFRFTGAIRARVGIHKYGYFTIAILFHGLIYALFARFEPVYKLAQGPDQVFMMLAIAAGTFHSAQYIALVCVVRIRLQRLREGDTAITRAVIRYFAACAVFSGGYLLIASATGVYPGQHLFANAGPLGTVTASEFALAIWNGIALHHYWLDERIWRIRRDPELARVLGLERAV